MISINIFFKKMETAAKSNRSHNNNVMLNFQTKVTADRLQREYGLMKQLLTGVKTQVEQLAQNADRCAERCPLKENTQQNQSFRFEENREIRRQLEKAILDLKGIQTENGREHRYLKSLQEQLYKEEKQGLANEEFQAIVSQLTAVHDDNCQLKMQVENIILQAKQKTCKVKSPVHHRTTKDNSYDEDFSFLAHSYKLE